MHNAVTRQSYTIVCHKLVDLIVVIVIFIGIYLNSRVLISVARPLVLQPFSPLIHQYHFDRFVVCHR